jgi:polyhydroxybutyrate depolymerase
MDEVHRTRVLPWVVAGACALAAGLLAGVVSVHPHAIAIPMIRVSQTSRPKPGRPRATPTPPSATPTPRPPTGATATTVTLDVGGMQRSYQLIRPVSPASAHLPALVVLHGINATADTEEQRDGLMPLAAAGEVVLAYPIGYGESWNAGVCCAPAMDDGIDDVGFVTAVIQQLSQDPGIDASRITLMGYSNGGRLAYQVDCAQPGLVSSVVVVLAAPVTPCGASAPVSLLQIATADDPEVPYGPGSDGDSGLTPVSDVASAWASRDSCAGDPTDQTQSGDLTVRVWSGCRWGTQVQLATYATGGHNWPVPTGGAPSPTRVIWSFAIGDGTPPP